MKNAFFLIWLIILPGCGAADWWFGAEQGVLFQGFDDIVQPGDQAELKVSLRGGGMLNGISDYTVFFYNENGQRVGAAKTGADGVAEFTVKLEEPGLYHFTATLDPSEVGTVEVPNAGLQVGVYTCDTRFLIVDLDGTIVAQAFDLVVLGDPSALPQSRQVLTELAGHYQVVYLTHRPECLGRRTRQWLSEHRMPPGPLIISRSREFLSGSETFKTKTIAQLTSKFPAKHAGVGDKPSDIQAYLSRGMLGVLLIDAGDDTPAGRAEILHELSLLPEGAQVVTNWMQAEAALSGQASYPPSALRKDLEEKIAATMPAGVRLEPKKGNHKSERQP